MNTFLNILPYAALAITITATVYQVYVLAKMHYGYKKAVAFTKAVVNTDAR